MKTLETVGSKLSGFSFQKAIRPYRVDGLIGIGLAIAIAIITYVGTYQIPDPIFTDLYAQDVWFGSDIPTVFGNITSFDSDFGRNNKHPLFPLLVFPLVYGPATLLNLDLITAARLLIVVTAMVWVMVLYVLFRVIGCYRLDATLLSILGGASAAATFWLVIPESFPLGSVTIILGLIFAALTQYRKFPLIWYVAINVITVSITITNAMVGIFTTVVNQSWKRIIQIGFIALFISTALWIVQRVIFTNAGFPFQPGTFLGEKKFISSPEHSSVLAAMSSFFYQTMVMPAVQFIPFPLRPDWIKLDTDTLAPASAGGVAMVAVVAWSGLLLMGLWGFFFTKANIKLRIVLGSTLLAQMAMHSIYGAEETFIYTLHFIPLLLALVAFSLLTRLRLLSLILITVLIISAGITNWAQFNHVTTNLWNYGTPRQQVEAQMKLRPSDPWLRNEGHVVLAATGSGEAGKAYHEPGGSFSPQPGSFGVSIWIVDANGNLQATSDNIPLEDIQQQLIENSDSGIPGIATQTPHYQMNWTAPQAGRWQLNLKPASNMATKPVLVIRSVGPAGGSVESLDWNGQRLLINQRWIVKNIPAQTKVYLGSERSPNWMRQTTTSTQWQDEYGWGYARLELDTNQPWQLEVEDLTPPPASDLALASTPTMPELNLPDSQFVDSFKAQIAHLTMGLVGNQTRPGDPLDYPLPRFRDGAYTLVALTRTGQIDLARQLVPYFAATDFQNGTRLAVDIPALGIWALTTVAQQVNQPEYDQILWPDIRRKAEQILDLITSNRPGYPVSTSAQLPFAENPDFVRMELTAGNMSALPGLIALDPSANVMSYRALIDAASFAERIDQPKLAKQWRSQAQQLQTAWQENFDLRFSEVETTYTSGLWPSGMVSANLDAFKANLENRWQALYEASTTQGTPPSDPTLSLAEAHQWLYLGQPDRAWAMVQNLWKHQTSPGLYTWWGSRDLQAPTSLSRWQRMRGWLNSSQLTPHYWTAAEMLLLQADMLVSKDPSSTTPTLTIGAGIPQDWLKQPLSVKGLALNDSIVDWSWNGQEVDVQLYSQNPSTQSANQSDIKLQLGPAFPDNTSVNVTTPFPSKQEQPRL